MEKTNPDFPLSPAVLAVELREIWIFCFILLLLVIHCLGGFEIGDKEYAAEKIAAETYQPYGDGRGNWDRHL